MAPHLRLYAGPDEDLDGFDPPPPTVRIRLRDLLPLVAMAQKDVKKLVAYSSVSQLGFVMLGLFAFNPNGINGAVMQMINHGISTGMLIRRRISSA